MRFAARRVPCKLVCDNQGGLPMRSMFEDLSMATLRYGAARFFRINKPKLLLACMPKSASSYLASVLGALPGMRERPVSFSHARREQEIDPIVAARNAMRGYVGQQHIRYSDETDRLMQRFGIDPIVLIRDLPDIVVSLRDHVRNESPEKPMAWITEAHAALPDDELDAMIVDFVMPWYFTFYVGWHTCERAVWVHYREVTGETAKTVRKICSQTRLNATDEQIEAAIAKANRKRPRLNVGKSGRGKALAPYAIERVNHFASYYPDIDFSPIGLPAVLPGEASQRPVATDAVSR